MYVAANIAAKWTRVHLAAQNSFEQMSVANRLREYFLSIGTSVHAVTKRCDFSRGSLDKMLRKGDGLHSDTIGPILRHYPDLDADWLLLGIGEMKRATPRPEGNLSPVEPRSFESKAGVTNADLIEEIRAVRRLLEEGHTISKGAPPAQKKNKAS